MVGGMVISQNLMQFFMQKPMGWSNDLFPNLQFQELGELIDVLNQS